MPIATVRDHNELLVAIRQRVEQLDLSHSTVEYLSGLQSGYLSKVVANPPPKRMQPFTWFLILQALGCELQIVENPQLMERLKPRFEKRKLRRKEVRSKSGIIELTPDFRVRRARLGGLARARLFNLSDINRRANLTRCRRYLEQQANSTA